MGLTAAQVWALCGMVVWIYPLDILGKSVRYSLLKPAPVYGAGPPIGDDGGK